MRVFHHNGEHPDGYFNCGIGTHDWDVNEVPLEFRNLVPACSLPYAEWFTDKWRENRRSPRTSKT